MNPYLYNIICQDAADGRVYTHNSVQGETIDECMAIVRALFDSPDDCVFLSITLADDASADADTSNVMYNAGYQYAAGYHD